MHAMAEPDLGEGCKVSYMAGACSQSSGLNMYVMISL
jgi:hypothetical protein